MLLLLLKSFVVLLLLLHFCDGLGLFEQKQTVTSYLTQSVSSFSIDNTGYVAICGGWSNSNQNCNEKATKLYKYNGNDNFINVYNFTNINTGDGCIDIHAFKYQQTVMCACENQT